MAPGISTSTSPTAHLSFFDRDSDGIISPWDTYVGLRKLHWGIFLSVLGMAIIHGGFAYFTQPRIIPDPLFRIHSSGISGAIHGSTTNGYAPNGDFVPVNFDRTFKLYSSLADKNGLTIYDTIRMVNQQRCALDFFGTFAAVFEWFATWMVLWPLTGKGSWSTLVIRKDDVQGIFDGTVFYRVAGEDIPEHL
ncbi:Caleosin-domain-containing protein [Cylindrobasidium torrendii FP15055 ss-10]|uniref:Caleosin-domain-containing protein n=1 Tax=Cylindrobasidium torrendii FP15055 ss-10 TaxID=1314674 RepID=A0A0D7AWJ6_9AGAR|nr:Caleosin-domain-containing protein [Cylindrobasidium torrendii FP15055 ss-10]